MRKTGQFIVGWSQKWWLRSFSYSLCGKTPEMFLNLVILRNVPRDSGSLFFAYLMRILWGSNDMGSWRIQLIHEAFPLTLQYKQTITCVPIRWNIMTADLLWTGFCTLVRTLDQNNFKYLQYRLIFEHIFSIVSLKYNININWRSKDIKREYYI